MGSNVHILFVLQLLFRRIMRQAIFFGNVSKSMHGRFFFKWILVVACSTNLLNSQCMDVSRIGGWMRITDMFIESYNRTMEGFGLGKTL